VFLWFCRLLAITVYLFLTFMHKAYASNIRNSTSLAISIYFSLCISYIGTYFFVILFIIYRHIDASNLSFILSHFQEMSSKIMKTNNYIHYRFKSATLQWLSHPGLNRLMGHQTISS
jgi:hypothetical protein